MAAHILLVDDEPDFVEAASLLLQIEGFRVSGLCEPMQALELVRRGLRPDVLLIDHRMPRLTGPELLQRLRAEGLRCPAVLVSAIAEVQRAAAAGGFEAALAKPFDVDRLTGLVHELLAAPSRDGRAPAGSPG